MRHIINGWFWKWDVLCYVNYKPKLTVGAPLSKISQRFLFNVISYSTAWENACRAYPNVCAVSAIASWVKKHKCRLRWATKLANRFDLCVHLKHARRLSINGVAPARIRFGSKQLPSRWFTAGSPQHAGLRTQTEIADNKNKWRHGLEQRERKKPSRSNGRKKISGLNLMWFVVGGTGAFRGRSK